MGEVSVMKRASHQIVPPQQKVQQDPLKDMLLFPHDDLQLLTQPKEHRTDALDDVLVYAVALVHAKSYTVTMTARVDYFSRSAMKILPS
jgi:hypothetical protein